jgi:hypothetical protein
LVFLLLPQQSAAVADSHALAVYPGVDPVLDAATELGIRDEGPVFGRVKTLEGGLAGSKGE